MKFTYSSDAKPVDGYTIRRGIHRGGFGEVYYAVSDAGKEVALKLLTHDQETELRGIRQCLNLKHPNLLTIYDVKTDDDGDHWVVMEYVQGASLDDVLAAYPQGLPLNEVRDWLAGICAGVDYLHDRGIVHRDLKPANVYRENGVVKIGDVGLSKQMGGDHRRQHTESVGTVYYMAPEVAQGRYGPEVDIYSLGVMTYEMLTGRLPFDGETAAEILMKHLTETPDLSPVPAAVRPVLAQALEKDPSKRTAKVRDFAEAVLRALDAASGQPGSAQPDRAPLTESAFLPRTQRETTRVHDTSRRNEGVSPERPSSGQSRKTFTQPPPRPTAVGPVWRGWLPWLALLVALWVPWTGKSWNAIGESLAVIGVWWGLLYAVAWWCTPARSVRLTGGAIRLPDSAELTFAEQLSGSLVLGTTLAAALTLACLWGMNWFDANWLGKPSPSVVGLMALTSALSTAALLSVGQTLNRGGARFAHPSSLTATIGAGVGTAAYALDQFLWAEFPDLKEASSSVFRHLGAQPLWNDFQPTLVAYVVFFAASLGLQNWRKLLDPYRLQRLRFWSIAYSGIWGWLVSLCFGVPRPYAVVWAVTITAAAQLAAPWRPGGKLGNVDTRPA
jgi:hypothetical protein